MRQIPVLLLTGFLGSGKTTFLNWLIQKHPDKKISIILNEFGDVKLESQFVEEKHAFIAELPGGCMCCIAKSDVPHVIHVILNKAPQTEYILIEASGLSDPSPIRETLEASGLSDRIFFDKTIAIIDAVNFNHTKQKYQIVLSQIADSDTLVISKTSETDKKSVSQIKNQLKNIVDIPIYEVSDTLNPNIFLTEKPRHISTPKKASKKPSQYHDIDSHESFDKLWFESERPIDMLKFQSLMNNLPPGIVRAKGFIKARDEQGVEQKLLVQYVNGRYELKVDTWDQKQKKQTALVFLGKNFDKNNLNTRLYKSIV